MSDQLHNSPESVVDAFCDRFENAWLAGHPERIESCLANCDSSLQEHLLGELLRIELELRRKAGDSPQEEEYLERFATHSQVVREVFSETIKHIAETPCTLAVGGIHVRCPHCHNPIELVADAEMGSIDCPSCGSNFSLISDESSTRHALSVKEFAHFKLVERLGAGGFGTVWKARDTKLDRTVAVKIPRQGQLDKQEEEQFLREARSAAQLNHPNIVSVHEVGREDDTIYIVSDLVRGVPLSEVIADSRLSFQEGVELVTKLANALHHAHERGVIHRDLKPQNVMIDDQGEPHLMDFGLAKREAGEITMTIDGAILGTPAYMSPEQARGEGHHVDRRTDVYSLGVILFQLLTGELPFRGTVRMLLYKIINEYVSRPGSLNPAIPRDLETITLKCLEKEPHKRYETAREVEEELKRYAEGHPIKARPLGPIARAWRWSTRNPTLSTSILLAFLLLVILLILGPGVAARESYLRSIAETQRQKAEQTSKELERSLRREKELSQNYKISANAERRARKEIAAESGRSICAQAILEAEQGDREFALLRIAKGVKLCDDSGDQEAREYARMCFSKVFRKKDRIVVGTESRVRALAFSEDGSKLAYGSEDGSLYEIDLTSKNERELYKASSGQTIVALTYGENDDCIICATSEGNLFTVSTSTGVVLGLSRHELIKQPAALESDYEGDALYVLNKDHSVSVVDANSLKVQGRVAKPIRRTNKTNWDSLYQDRVFVIVSEIVCRVIQTTNGWELMCQDTLARKQYPELDSGQANAGGVFQNRVILWMIGGHVLVCKLPNEMPRLPQELQAFVYTYNSRGMRTPFYEPLEDYLRSHSGRRFQLHAASNHLIPKNGHGVISISSSSFSLRIRSQPRIDLIWEPTGDILDVIGEDFTSIARSREGCIAVAFDKGRGSSIKVILPVDSVEVSSEQLRLVAQYDSGYMLAEEMTQQESPSGAIFFSKLPEDDRPDIYGLKRIDAAEMAIVKRRLDELGGIPKTLTD